MKQNFHKYFSMNDMLLVAVLLVALALAWNTVSAMQRNYHLQQKYDELKADVELQELENKNLAYKIQYLKSDDYLELAARDKFDQATAGEKLVYLPSNLVAKQAPIAQNKPVEKTESEPEGWRGNIMVWKRFLSGKPS